MFSWLVQCINISCVVQKKRQSENTLKSQCEASNAFLELFFSAIRKFKT